MLNTNKKETYSAPETEVFRIQMERGILSLSGNDASLSGAGVNESDADEAFSAESTREERQDPQREADKRVRAEP